MKNAAYIFITLFAFVILIIACTKKLDSIPAGKIAATKVKLKINEADTLLLVGADSTKTVNWSISPAGYDTLTTKKNAARLVFNKSGSYTVYADQNGGTPASIVISVSDSVYTPPSNPLFSLLTGDQLTLTPSIYTSRAGDTTALAFTVTTTNSYCTNSVLSIGYGGYDNIYAFTAVGVSHFNPCGVGSGPLTGSFNYGLFHPVLVNGTYSFTATLNGTNYTGSIVVTTTTVTFNWPYTSGVLITPKQISK